VNITQEQFDEAVLELTGRPEWAVFEQGLKNEIYQSQARALSAESWEVVCRLRGFAEGLSFVGNLRAMTVAAQENNDASV